MRSGSISTSRCSATSQSFELGNEGLAGTLIVPDPINGALFLSIGLVKVGP
jgi:hypothetical protein